MGAKTFRHLHDFVRHGMNVELTCGNPHCKHIGIVDAFDLECWFRIHRWPAALEAGVHLRIRCSKCRARPSSIKPTDANPTVTDFFPADERGWKRKVGRLRD